MVIVLNNGKIFRLLYSAVDFTIGLTVTGYFIYPDKVKSSVFTFDDLGDGVYAIEITGTRESRQNTEKYGLVIKENGVVKKFEIIQMHY